MKSEILYKLVTISSVSTYLRAIDGLISKKQELNIILQRYIRTTIHLFPTSNTKSNLLGFLYSMYPKK